ncbi:unnamed protein product [Meloidogyne enterolobii]|uniref:Uncharacterized protein n=1 Tax=Meloidogyne enterolobii TaxID=390850 RepID=A0ACB0ZF12_MELEN
MSNSFFVFLPSNVSDYPENQPNSFRVHLPKSIFFNGDWVCGLHSISYPYSWPSTIGTLDDQWIKIHIIDSDINKHVLKIPVPKASHNTTEALRDFLNANLEQQSKEPDLIFAPKGLGKENIQSPPRKNRKERDVELKSPPLYFPGENCEPVSPPKISPEKSPLRSLSPNLEKVNEELIFASKGSIQSPPRNNRKKRDTVLKSPPLYFPSENKNVEPVSSPPLLKSSEKSSPRVLSPIVKTVNDETTLSPKPSEKLPPQPSTPRIETLKDNPILSLKSNEQSPPRVLTPVKALTPPPPDQIVLDQDSPIRKKKKIDTPPRQLSSDTLEERKETNISFELFKDITWTEKMEKVLTFILGHTPTPNERQKYSSNMPKLISTYEKSNPSQIDLSIQEQVIKSIKFQYNSNFGRFKIVFDHPSINYISLSPQLGYVLGFENPHFVQNNEIAKYGCDLKGGFSSFAVYAKGLTENMIIGNSLSSLLRVVSVSGATPGEYNEKIYDTPIYARVLPREINEIEIELRTLDNGRLIPFSYGIVLVVLIFKKVLKF